MAAFIGSIWVHGCYELSFVKWPNLKLCTTFSVGFVLLLVILNGGFQNDSFYRVGVKKKLVKLIQFSLTKLSYELMVVTTLTSETVFDGLLNQIGRISCLVSYRIQKSHLSNIKEKFWSVFQKYRCLLTCNMTPFIYHRRMATGTLLVSLIERCSSSWRYTT